MFRNSTCSSFDRRPISCRLAPGATAVDAADDAAQRALARAADLRSRIAAHALEPQHPVAVLELGRGVEIGGLGDLLEARRPGGGIGEPQDRAADLDAVWYLYDLDF